MKTFFDPRAQSELRERIQKLTSSSTCEWGKMSPAQMLAHCTAAMRLPIGELATRKTPLSLIGWMFKRVFRNDKPFGKNAPTIVEFRMRDDKDFDAELKNFQDAFARLSKGSAAITSHWHPFFGKMTDDDWGHLLYKHLDHHFRQFGI